MILKKSLKLIYCVLFGCYGLSVNNSHAAYEEPGKAGSPSSWKTGEFNRQWGLGAISAEHAYAAGYSGKGVTIGTIDGTVFPHPEFDGKLSRRGDNSYGYSSAGSNTISFSDHGTHVAGIMAAKRDGEGMHGVAFDADLISAKLTDYGNRNVREELIQSDARVINNSWGIPPAGRLKQDDVIREVKANKSRVDRLSRQPIPGDNHDSMAVLQRAARHGKLLVLSAGNYGNDNVPEVQKSLPHAFPEELNHYLVVSNLNDNDRLYNSSTPCGHTASYCVAAPGVEIHSTSGRFVSGRDGPINRAAYDRGDLSVQPRYAEKTGTSMSTPHVTGAAAVLMQRFPYMNAEQIATVIKTTATDLGARGVDDVYGWGKVNLREAINGPKMLITREDIPAEFYVAGSYTEKQFVANIPGKGSVVEAGTPVERRCNSAECDADVWSNAISGHGGLTKTGSGTLELRGKNTYRGDTRIQQGTLAINGSVASAVTVGNGGTLAGHGAVNSFRAQRGGSVNPGNGIATLRVENEAVFEAGSLYEVEVAANGRSDKIAAKRAQLNGGEVNVRLEHSKNLLSQNEAQSLVGKKYTILSATDGITGRFSKANPSYQFINIALDYQGNDVGMGIQRTGERFESHASTENAREVARAVETLGVTETETETASTEAAEPVTAAVTHDDGDSGSATASANTRVVTEEDSTAASHPVYESFLTFTSDSELQQATGQLSGQIHADMASALLSDSQAVRDTATQRLRQAEGDHSASGISADDSGAWAKLLGGWGRASGNDNAAGYKTSTTGVLLGVDRELAGAARLGVMAAYTRTSLHGGYQSDGHSDNYHLGLYGSKRAGALALRAGGGYTWHQIDTSRSVNYSAQSDTEQARYQAGTGQMFIESGYRLGSEAASAEPFAALAYLHSRNGGIAEQGGAAALRGDKQSLSATVSTLGVRAATQWQAADSVAIRLHGELGWQRQYGRLERDMRLMFRNTDAAFAVNSVPVSRDSAVLKAGVDVNFSNNATLSVSYGGHLAKNHQDNSVNASLIWHF